MIFSLNYNFPFLIRLKRSAPGDRDTLEISFVALGREFVLLLEPDHSIFHKVSYQLKIKYYFSNAVSIVDRSGPARIWNFLGIRNSRFWLRGPELYLKFNINHKKIVFE
jgi:hypothetical protein